MDRGEINPREQVQARQRTVDAARDATERWARRRKGENVPVVESNEYHFVNSNIGDYENTFSVPQGYFFEFLLKAREAHPERPLRVLDYGCGTGEALRDLARFAAAQNPPIQLELTGVSAGDPRNEEEKKEDEQFGITFDDKTRGAFTPTPDRFDLVVSSGTFTYLHDPLGDLTKLYNSLQLGGVLHTDFTIGKLQERFYGTDTPDRDQSLKAMDDALAVFAALAKSGIDIKLTQGKIVRNTVPMEFPNVRVRGLDDAGVCQYELVRDSRK